MQVLLGKYGTLLYDYLILATGSRYADSFCSGAVTSLSARMHELEVRMLDAAVSNVMLIKQSTSLLRLTVLIHLILPAGLPNCYSSDQQSVSACELSTLTASSKVEV